MNLEIQMELTSRDKQLLRLLLIVVITVGFLFLGIRPLLENYAHLKEQVEQEQAAKELNDEKIESLPLLQMQCETLRNEVALKTADYYPVMTSNVVDQLMTGMVLGQGLTAKNLAITIPEEGFTVEPYQYAEAAETETEGVNEVMQSFGLSLNTADASETTENTGTSSVAEEVVSDDIEAVRVNMTVTGKKENMTALIDLIAEEYPAIRIISYSWDTSEENKVSEDGASVITVWDELQMVLEIYMYTGK